METSARPARTPTPPGEQTEAQRLIIVGYRLYMSTCCGPFPQAPSTVALSERMRDVQPGDLVFEASSAYRCTRDPGAAEDALGWLIRVEQHPVVNPAEFAKQENGWDGYDGWPDYAACPKEKRYRIRRYGRPEDDEFTWANAEFLAVPTSMNWGRPEL